MLYVFTLIVGAIGMFFVIKNNPGILYPFDYIRGKKSEIADRLRESVRKRIQ